MNEIAYFCPDPEHTEPLENRLAESTNTGLTCHECRDLVFCDACNWQGRYSQHRITWISNAEKAKLLGHKPNWRDGGVYGLCPSCKAAITHSKSGWWLNKAGLLNAGGRAEAKPMVWWIAHEEQKPIPRRLTRQELDWYRQFNL